MTLLAIPQVAGKPHVVEVIDRLAESVDSEIARQVFASVDLVNHGAEVHRLRWTCRDWPHIRIRCVGVMAQHAHYGLIAIVAVHAQAIVALVAVVDRHHCSTRRHWGTIHAETDHLVRPGIPHGNLFLGTGQ